MEPHRPPPRTSETPRSARDEGWLRDVAVRYVARWEATRKSVADLLERRVREESERNAVDPPDADRLREAIPAIVEDLVARGYVDDRRFAEHAYQKARRQGRSQAQIEVHFAQKGISSEILTELLATASSSGDHPDPETVDAIGEELTAAFRLARKRRLGPFASRAKQAALRHAAAAAAAAAATHNDAFEAETHDESEGDELTSTRAHQKERNRQLAILARQGFSLAIAAEVIDARSVPSEIAEVLTP